MIMETTDHQSGQYDVSGKSKPEEYDQALVYEASDRSRTPPHTPKMLEKSYKKLALIDY